MPIIRSKQINGKKDTAKKCKGGKKAYTDGYRIIKKKIQTDKRDRLQKTGTEERDNRSFLLFKIILW